jgi:hypothetical protein
MKKGGKTMKSKKKISFLVAIGIVVLLVGITIYSCNIFKETIGVIFVVHTVHSERPADDAQHDFDSMVTQFAYDHNHPVNRIIWNPDRWGAITASETSIKMNRKYGFMYGRLGGPDPSQSMSDAQMADMKAELDEKGDAYSLEFEVEFACWSTGTSAPYWPYPRFIYYGPDGPDEGYNCNYCGELGEGGPWEGCNPERYNIDGPVERLLKKGASRIIVIDVTVGGVRFGKTYDVVQMTKRALNDWNEENGTNIPLMWVNDYTNLMERSYPTEPEGWTRSLGIPEVDQEVPLGGSPNPVSEDPLLATLHVEAIEAEMSPSVSEADTGVVILNHALHDNNECFDPKIDDTLILNKNIKSQLLAKYPAMDADNIIGAYMGIKEINPENGLNERTREMRGENIGHAWLYESDKELPGEEWGYRYWEALEYLKNRGVQHIIIDFPQIVISSTYDLVEFPNQIAKEIGFKNWIKWGAPDYTTYPEAGHPFTDYWGNWVETDCGGTPCCFEMGGCDDGRPYPPPRQAPLDKARGDLDPSLAYAVSEYGHLGYDPALGDPDPDAPVQEQYTGTWAIYTPPNDNPEVGKLLATHVLNAALGQYE